MAGVPRNEVIGAKFPVVTVTIPLPHRWCSVGDVHFPDGETIVYSNRSVDFGLITNKRAAVWQPSALFVV